VGRESKRWLIVNPARVVEQTLARGDYAELVRRWRGT